jgi:hypothetical protein
MTEPQSEVVPKAEKASIVEDFVDILYAPSKVFARREKASFFPPMLIVAIAIGLLFIVNSGVMQPIMEAEFERGMAAAMKANPQMTQEQMQQGRAVAMTIGKVAIFVIIPISMLVVGVVLFLCGKLVDAKQTMGAALMVSAYSYAPRIIESVLVPLQGLLIDVSQLRGRYQLTLSAARFMDPDTTSPLLLAIAGRFDVFIIWVTVLLAIGLSVTGKIPLSRAAIAAFMVWVAGALPQIWPALSQ